MTVDRIRIGKHIEVDSRNPAIMYRDGELATPYDETRVRGHGPMVCGPCGYVGDVPEDWDGYNCPCCGAYCDNFRRVW